MDEKRKGEIAYKVLKYKAKKEGNIMVGKNIDRELGNVAKEIDVPFEELKEFTGQIARELFEEVWGK